MEPIVDAVFDIGVEIVVAILGIVGAFVLAKARSTLDAIEARTGIEISEAARQRLEAAIRNGIARAETRVGEATPEQVIDYIQEFNPDTLAFFDLHGQRLKRRVEAAIAKHKETAW